MIEKERGKGKEKNGGKKQNRFVDLSMGSQVCNYTREYVFYHFSSTVNE